MTKRRCLPVLFGLCFAAALCCASSAFADKPKSGKAKIVPDGAQLELLWNDGEFTEGVAVAPDGRIYFSDIARGEKPGRILRFDPKTKKTDVFSADSGKSNGLMFDRQGRLIAACGANYGKRAICEVRPDGTLKVLADRYNGKRLNAPNDLVIHPDGSIYFSDPRYIGPEEMELDHMSVYRLTPAGNVTLVTSDIEKPNGVALSPDLKTLYVAETNNGTTHIVPGVETTPGRMTLNAFPLKPNGRVGKKRVLVDFGKELGTDGMTVDTEGRIYAAVRAAKRHGIIVFSPAGKELAYVPTEPLPTNCCFGIGEESHTLYVTAGAGLYRIRLNATGFHPATAPVPKP